MAEEPAAAGRQRSGKKSAGPGFSAEEGPEDQGNRLASMGFGGAQVTVVGPSTDDGAPLQPTIMAAAAFHACCGPFALHRRDGPALMGSTHR